MNRVGSLLYKQLAGLVLGRGILTPPVKQTLSRPLCRCCGSEQLELRGKLPDARIFAGTLLDNPLPGGQLYACKNCGLVFRDPIFSKETYDHLYLLGDSTTWDESDRIDHDLVRDALRRHVKSGAVLDIGCGTGGLLMPLSSVFEKFGAEINDEAAQIAEMRGIGILAQDIEDVAELPYLFDAVIACDVIEHVANPVEFVRLLLSKTSRGGWVVISTANADAWSWRLAGSRFWYCFLPEHISFVSPNWFANHAASLGIRIAEVKEFVYSVQLSRLEKILRLPLMALFRLSPKLYYSILPPSRRTNIPVGRGITRDHFMIVLRKL